MQATPKCMILSIRTHQLSKKIQQIGRFPYLPAGIFPKNQAPAHAMGSIILKIYAPAIAPDSIFPKLYPPAIAPGSTFSKKCPPLSAIKPIFLKIWSPGSATDSLFPKIGALSHLLKGLLLLLCSPVLGQFANSYANFHLRVNNNNIPPGSFFKSNSCRS